MNIFEAVRDLTREAAEANGITVNRNGMARCPFHNDRTPSMKIDKRFHCFGCGADGDAIDLTARLFGLSKLDAAKKLAADFNIPYEGMTQADRKAVLEKKRQREQLIRYEEIEQTFFAVLSDYYLLLDQWREAYPPPSPDAPGEWDALFCEAGKEMPKIGYLMDCFIAADLEERIDIMIEYGKKVKSYARIVKYYRPGKTGKV